MFALAKQGWRGRQPPSKETMSSWGGVRRPPAAEGSRDAQIVLCASRCWRSGLYRTKKLNIYENENHCVRSKLHSDFVYVDFRMCEQNTLSKLYGNLLQTSSLWHRAARGTTRSARDPSSHTPAGAPQDDNVFLAGGFAPRTPIRNCEHSCLTIIVQFDILFFHIQVCQQSEPAPLSRGGSKIHPLIWCEAVYIFLLSTYIAASVI